MLKKTMLYLLVTVILINFLSTGSFSQNGKNLNYSQLKEYHQKINQNLNPNRKKGNKWLDRWLWINRFNFNSSGKFIPMEEFTASDKNTGTEELQSKNSWIPLGPETITPTYEYRSGHGLGRVNCFAFHPANPDIIWIGTPGGGIWKTVNSGKSWTPLTDFLPSLQISHIAVDPINPDIIYFCSGDFDSGGMSSSDALGVFKTTDGGISWNKTSLNNLENFNYSFLKKLIINPENTNEIITVGMYGIWKSSDAGENWYSINDSLIYDLDIDPSNPKILYAAMGTMYNYFGSAGVLKSTDFGETWKELNTGISPKGGIARMDIAVSPVNPNTLYLLNVSYPYNDFNSLYISTDAGNSWQQKSNRTSSRNILGAYDGGADDQGGQGFYDLTLLPDPTDENKIYIGGVNIWMSEDMGKTFEISSLWMNVFGKSIHADQHYSEYNPNNKYFYFSNDGGIYRTKIIGAGKAEWIEKYIDKEAEDLKDGAPDTMRFPTVWENLSSGLNISEFYKMNIAKDNPGYITGGTQDNSCFYNSGSEWINYIANFDGMETMINYKNPNIIYGVWQMGGLCRSDDGGKIIIKGLADTISNKMGEQGDWVTPVAMDPVNPSIIYIGFQNLWKSEDNGDNWTKILNFDSLGFYSQNKNSLTLVKTSSKNGGYIAAYKPYDYDGNRGELWLTKDYGKTWLNSTSFALDTLNISCLEFDENNPEKIWASCYRTKLNLFVSEDFGQTWQNYSKPLPKGLGILTFVSDPESTNNTIYAGTNKGVYYTDDNMTEWLPYLENLPKVKITDIELQRQTHEIFAATYGRGIWKTTSLTSVNNNELANNFSFEIFPNPVKNKLNLHVNNLPVSYEGQFKISVIDIAGKTVSVRKIHNLKENFDTSIDIDLLPGIYFVNLIGGGLNYSQKFVVEK